VEPILHWSALNLSLALEALALVTIAVGAIEATFDIARVLFKGPLRERAKRRVWLRFAGWLVAGLTFQLAADIVHTTVAPGWDEIGRVAAIAAIRTFLTFFLDRDIEAEHRRKQEDDDLGRD